MPPVTAVPASTFPLTLHVSAPLHISTPPGPALKIAVVMPVRDEEEALPAALFALAHQTDGHGAPLDPACYEIIVLANNCQDHSAQLARRFARSHPCLALHVAEVTLPPAAANIGTARRMAMDEACRRFFQCRAPGGIIASTDGDVEVAPDWLFQTLRAFTRGVDAVGGRIRTKAGTGDDPEAQRYARQDGLYQRGLARLESLIDPSPFNPWPRHHQFFGGSLAVTAEAYCRVGGLPRVACLEDMALEQALARHDARVCHSLAVRVRASARQAGRADLGLAAQLREWGEMGRANRPHYVQQPQAVETRLRARAVLKTWHQQAAEGRMPGADAVNELARELAVPCTLLHAGLSQPQQPFGALWEQVMECHAEVQGVWARRWPLWEIMRALPDLKMRLAECLRAE